VNQFTQKFVELPPRPARLGVLHQLTHIETIQHNDAASWNYDPIAEEYYYGFGYTIVSTGAKIPIAAEFM
jgi:hypothetical protein